MALPKPLSDEAYDLLVGPLAEPQQRREWLHLAFGSDHPELAQGLDWSGDAATFTRRCIRELEEARCIAPQQHALSVLLETLREMQVYGVDRAVRVDRLVQQLNDALCPRLCRGTKPASPRYLCPTPASTRPRPRVAPDARRAGAAAGPLAGSRAARAGSRVGDRGRAGTVAGCRMGVAGALRLRDYPAARVSGRQHRSVCPLRAVALRARAREALPPAQSASRAAPSSGTPTCRPA